MAKPSKKSVTQILKDLGVKIKKGTIEKYTKLADNREVFRAAKKKSTNKEAKKQYPSYNAYFSKKVVSDPKSVFQKDAKEYENTYGTPTATILKDKEQKAQETARGYYQPRFEDLANTTAEQRRRIEEDAGLGLGTLEQEFQKQQQDLTRQRQFAEQEFGAAQQQNILQDQLQNEALIADINAAGQFDSSLRGTRQGQLAQQQQAEIDAMNRSRERQLYGFDQAAAQGTQGYQQALERYRRQQARDIYDLNALEKEKRQSLEESQRGYGTELISGELQNIAQVSQNYYDRKSTVDNDAAKFLEDYSTLGI